MQQDPSEVGYGAPPMPPSPPGGAPRAAPPAGVRTDGGPGQGVVAEREAEAAATRGRVDQLGRHAWALVGIGLSAVGVLFLVSQMSWIVVPAVLTGIIGVIAAAPVGWMSRRGVRRGIATVVVYIVIVAVVVAAFVFVGRSFVSQVGELTLDVPQLGEDLAGQLDDLRQRIETASPAAADAVARFRQSVVDSTSSFGADLADSVFGLVGAGIGILTGLLLGLILSFVVVKDLPKLTAGMRRWLDRSENMRARGAAAAMSRSVTGFVRGQLLVAVIVGLLKTLVFWLLGLPYFVPLGVLSGVGNLVPGIGPVVVAIPPVLVAWSQGGVAWALLTIGALVVVQVASAWWFHPRLVGTVIELPTLIVIVALVIGAVSFGFFGLIAAVPVAAAIRDLVHWLLLPEDRVEDELGSIDERKTPQRRRFRDSRRRAAGVASESTAPESTAPESTTSESTTSESNG